MKLKSHEVPRGKFSKVKRGKQIENKSTTESNN